MTKGVVEDVAWELGLSRKTLYQSPLPVRQIPALMVATAANEHFSTRFRQYDRRAAAGRQRTEGRT